MEHKILISSEWCAGTLGGDETLCAEPVRGTLCFCVSSSFFSLGNNLWMCRKAHTRRRWWKKVTTYLSLVRWVNIFKLSRSFARFREFLCFFSLSSLFRSFGGFSERASARGDGEYNKVFGPLIDDGVARKCAAMDVTRKDARIVRYSGQWWLKNFFRSSWVRKMMYKFKLSLKYSIEKRHAQTSLWSNFSIDHYYRWFTFINTCIPTTPLSLSLSIIHISSSMRVSYYSLGKGAQ